MSRAIIATLWLAWAVIWLVAAGGAKTTRRRETLRSQALHRLPLLIAAVLVFWRRPLPPPLMERFLPATPMVAALGVVMVAAGLGFAVWARWYLGANWSGTVTVKVRHELIRTGPYRCVRHPIYTGLLLAIAGSALVLGEWRDAVAFGFALLALIVKSRVEERWMDETFPEYQAYRQETAALVPFIY
ncbi:MAG TPA: isoprenylcysteine carboxylmethyltransferase family protein [Stellaceae bacterium]|nr:isoprenylcysteine carboxylmethyltransferase family protein [Stellaceae bacterium]